MYSVLIFIQVQHKFIKLHLHSAITLIQTVTLIFYSSSKVFYPFNNFLFIQHLLSISHCAWSNALTESLLTGGSLNSVASFLRMYLFPGKAKYRCEGEYRAVEFIILGRSAIACYYSW